MTIKSHLTAGRDCVRRGAAGFALLLAASVLAACGQGDERQELFDLQRLSAEGKSYTGNGDFATQPWACVFDRNTGLVWEVKTAEEGLRSASNTYSWYVPDNERLTEREIGTPGAGQCTGSDCDTAAYVRAVNEEGLCGFSDWRLPEIGELTTLNDPAIEAPGPTLPVDYFPNARPAPYWSATSYRFHYTGAWLWDFQYGFDRVDWKSSGHYLRLVRGELDPSLRRAPDS